MLRVDPVLGFQGLRCRVYACGAVVVCRAALINEKKAGARETNGTASGKCRGNRAGLRECGFGVWGLED